MKFNGKASLAILNARRSWEFGGVSRRHMQWCDVRVRLLFRYTEHSLVGLVF